MIRLCVFLLWNALECSVRLPFERLRQWRTRQAKQSWTDEHGGVPDEVLEDFNSQPDEEVMSEQLQSFLRGVLKVAAGALVAKGAIDATDAVTLQVALEALLGGAMGLWAFWASHKKHA